MTARRSAVPEVPEIRVSRDAPLGQIPAARTQRELVAASLLLCPYRSKTDARRGDRRV